MSFCRRNTLLLILAISFLVFQASAVSAYTPVFSGSSCYRYMQAHMGSGEKSRRIRAIQKYFCTRNPKLASKTARTYAILVERTSRKDGLDPFLVASIIVKESTVNRMACSGKSYGLMQINWNANKAWIPRVFPEVKSRKELYRSAKNIDVGCYILKKALERSGGSVDKALDRYRGKSLVSYRKKVLSYYCGIVKIFRAK